MERNALRPLLARTETFANGGVDPDLPFNFPDSGHSIYPNLS